MKAPAYINHAEDPAVSPPIVTLTFSSYHSLATNPESTSLGQLPPLNIRTSDSPVKATFVFVIGDPILPHLPSDLNPIISTVTFPTPLFGFLNRNTRSSLSPYTGGVKRASFLVQTSTAKAPAYINHVMLAALSVPIVTLTLNSYHSPPWSLDNISLGQLPPEKIVTEAPVLVNAMLLLVTGDPISPHVPSGLRPTT